MGTWWIGIKKSDVGIQEEDSPSAQAFIEATGRSDFLQLLTPASSYLTSFFLKSGFRSNRSKTGGDAEFWILGSFLLPAFPELRNDFSKAIHSRQVTPRAVRVSGPSPDRLHRPV